jgi:hypothetical protein
MTSPNDFALQELSNPRNNEEYPANPAGNQEFSLPLADRGKDAYLFLASCFTVEALVWGFPFSFGVFQDYYSTSAPFKNESNIAVIGTTATVLPLIPPFR